MTQVLCARCLAKGVRVRDGTFWTEDRMPRDYYLLKPYVEYEYGECDDCKRREHDTNRGT